MSLEGYDLRKPVWKMEILRAPPEIDQALLERSVVRLQYIERLGKGQFPKFVIEFDNSSKRIWHWSTLAIGLRLKMRFGYPNLLSRKLLAVVTKVKGRATGDAGKPLTEVGSPRPDPHGLVIMEAKAYAWKLHEDVARTEWVSADGQPLSRAIEQIALAYGYKDNQIFVQPGLGWNKSSLADEPKFDLRQIRADQSALDYLNEMAKEYGVIFKYTPTEFRWHNEGYKQKQAEVISYYQNPDLLDYSIEGDFAMSPQSVNSE